MPQRAVTELQDNYQAAVFGDENKVAIENVRVGDRVDPLWMITEVSRRDSV